MPLAEIAIHALRAEPPNLVLATDLMTEIEGRLFMRSESMRYPFLPRWKLMASTQRVSSVDIVINRSRCHLGCLSSSSSVSLR